MYFYACFFIKKIVFTKLCYSDDKTVKRCQNYSKRNELTLKRVKFKKIKIVLTLKLSKLWLLTFHYKCNTKVGKFTENPKTIIYYISGTVSFNRSKFKTVYSLKSIYLKSEKRGFLIEQVKYRVFYL